MHEPYVQIEEVISILYVLQYKNLFVLIAFLRLHFEIVWYGVALENGRNIEWWL